MHRRTYIGLASLALTSACGFTIPNGSGTPDDASSPDTSNGSDALVGVCPWPYVPEYAMPCPATDGPEIDFTTGKGVLDTDDGTLTSGIVPIPIESEVVADIRVVWTRGLHIATDAEIRVVGSLPLIFIATGSITIDGLLDGAGHANSAVLAKGPAGANPSECEDQMAGAGVGQPCAAEGASGGGGGSFAEMGGQGGGGGDNRNCVAFTGPVPGGSGGVPLITRPINLRGGCPGAIGGTSLSGGALAGPGGSGGGAIALVARDAITIDGKVNVGGSGGHGAAHRSGGGGGGSGGMIVLEGSSVVITSSGRVTANGGGGGGGCDGGTGGDGEDGQDSTSVADGGNGADSGTNGGDGGARSSTPDAAAISGRGGGGGGGGVGFVRVHSALSPGQSGSSSFSPTPSP